MFNFFIQHSLPAPMVSVGVRYSIFPRSFRASACAGISSAEQSILNRHCQRSTAVSKYLAPRPVLSKVEGFNWAFALSQSVICTMQYEKKSEAYAKLISIGPEVMQYTMSFLRKQESNLLVSELYSPRSRPRCSHTRQNGLSNGLVLPVSQATSASDRA